MRLCTLLAIAALLAADLGALTLEEAAAYIQRDPAGASADIVRLDAIEHATPVLTGGALAVLVTDDGLVRAYPTSPLVVDVAGELRYVINLPTATARISRPPPRLGALLAASAVGLAAGALAVAVVGR